MDLRRSLAEVVFESVDKADMITLMLGKCAMEDVVVVDEDVMAPSESFCRN